MIGFAKNYLLWHVPHEYGSLGTNRNNSSLIRGDRNLADISRVTDTLIVSNTLIIVPDFDSLVLASRDEVLSGFSYGQGVDLSGIGTIEHSNGLSVEAIPVGNLSVTSGGEHLRFVWMIEHLFEHGGLEEAHHSGVVNDVPNDGRTIIRRGDSLSILLVDLNIRHSSSVFLKGSLHDLGLSTDSPDSDLSLHASRDNLLAVVGSSDGSHTVVVSIVDSEQELS